jgi:hypothetical protein
MDQPKLYDWERIRLALRQLDQAFPGLLQSVVLIGGGAAWFYRENLRQWADADFPVPATGPAEEEIWLSKDVDFMGLTVAEAADLLQTPWDETTHTFHYAGLEVDFLEEGLVLFPAEALRSARQAQLPDVTFNVAEAALLYAEKCALLARKARPQDHLHHALLARFLRCEFCRQAETPANLRTSRWVARARDVKTADLRFFENDARFNLRLAKAIAALSAPEHRALKHWAKHHLPGYKE